MSLVDKLTIMFSIANCCCLFCLNLLTIQMVHYYARWCTAPKAMSCIEFESLMFLTEKGWWWKLINRRVNETSIEARLVYQFSGHEVSTNNLSYTIIPYAFDCGRTTHDFAFTNSTTTLLASSKVCLMGLTPEYVVSDHPMSHNMRLLNHLIAQLPVQGYSALELTEIQVNSLPSIF